MINRVVRYSLMLAFLIAPSMMMANAQQWVTYGNKQLAAKQYDQAGQSFSKALQYDKQNAAAYQGLGSVYMGKGDKAKALQYYNYSLKLNPGNAALKAYVAKIGGGASSGGGNQAAYY